MCFIEYSGKLNNKYIQPGEVGNVNVPPNPPVLVNFQLLKQKYVGAKNEGEFMQTFNLKSEIERTCVLIVQGHVFKG